MLSLIEIHQNLPEDVHTYPTLKGKKRFELMQTFNLVLAVYIALHKAIMPLFIYLTQSESSSKSLEEMSYWYLYHFAIALLLCERCRTPQRAFWIVYTAWFGLGFLPLMLMSAFWQGGEILINWKTISSILCYGSSLIFTIFLLYRMRMPTTAYLYRIKDRIIPKPRYAIPYFLIGIIISWINTFGY